MRYWLVMPAAGAGQRFGGPLPKQYAPLVSRTVIEWSLASFVADDRCAGIRVVIAANDAHWAALDLTDPSGRLSAVEGGARRCDSVLRGLEALDASPDDWVLVHDAARPCLHPDERDRLLDAGRSSDGEGALLALPLADTLKRADDQQRVDTTIDRRGLWRAQTPQMFRHGVLSAALRACEQRGIESTDEAQAVEAAGGRPRLVPGFSTNLKVTTATDLELADAILRGVWGHE